MTRIVRTRAEDGPRGFAGKLLATILSALLVGAIGWLYATVLDLVSRQSYMEYYLKWKGILPP